jgi:hypothetical protein
LTRPRDGVWHTLYMAYLSTRIKMAPRIARTRVPNPKTRIPKRVSIASLLSLDNNAKHPRLGVTASRLVCHYRRGRWSKNFENARGEDLAARNWGELPAEQRKSPVFAGLLLFNVNLSGFWPAVDRVNDLVHPLVVLDEVGMDRQDVFSHVPEVVPEFTADGRNFFLNFGEFLVEVLES